MRRWCWLLVLVVGVLLLGRGSVKTTAAKVGLTKPQLCVHCGATGWIDDTHMAPAAMLGQRTASGCRVCGNDGVVGLEICRDCGEVLPHEPDSAQALAHTAAMGYGNRTAEGERRRHDWGRRKWDASWSAEPLLTQDEVDVMAAGGLRPLRERPKPYDFECPICERELDFEDACEAGDGLITLITLSEGGSVMGTNTSYVCNQPECAETARERNQQFLTEARQ